MELEEPPLAASAPLRRNSGAAIRPFRFRTARFTLGGYVLSAGQSAQHRDQGRPGTSRFK